MLSQLSITLLRLGFLVLLWALVLSAISVLRADIYGTRVLNRGRGLTARKPDKTRASAPPRSATGVRGRNPARHMAVTAGPLKGTTIPLTSAPVSIGRAPTSTLVLEDDYSSARHARIFLEGESWFIEDLGSTNGTLLNGHPVVKRQVLSDGDKIRVGHTELTFEVAKSA